MQPQNLRYNTTQTCQSVYQVRQRPSRLLPFLFQRYRTSQSWCLVCMIMARRSSRIERNIMPLALRRHRRLVRTPIRSHYRIRTRRNPSMTRRSFSLQFVTWRTKSLNYNITKPNLNTPLSTYVKRPSRPRAKEEVRRGGVTALLAPFLAVAM